MSANPFWTDARLATQRPAARAFTLPSPAVEAITEAVGGRADARRRDFSVPSWVFFCTLMLATFAVCVTVTMRADAAMRGAAQKYEQMSTDVGQIRDTNAALKREVERLRSDPRTIETAARARLNMVHPNEVVVPLR
ncbi:MAG TPA: septum formation initiator family protein [Pyrinomonadaceae bacterium]|nr:septum formation initiator family protein [Pyrinomonadaceae bacterium]